MEPTQVTVVEHERRSDFREWVDRNGIKAAVLAIAISAVILGAQYSDQGAESVHAAERDLLNTASEDLGGASPASLDGLLGEPEGTAVEPWGGVGPGLFGLDILRCRGVAPTAAGSR